MIMNMPVMLFKQYVRIFVFPKLGNFEVGPWTIITTQLQGYEVHVTQLNDISLVHKLLMIEMLQIYAKHYLFS